MKAKLKRLLAEAELDKAALKDLLGRKWQARRQGARRASRRLGSTATWCRPAIGEPALELGTRQATGFDHPPGTIGDGQLND